ncbi:membrane protein [Wenjunlia tyrosinilytica]|uniref:Membrane protein n=1 Tax=Wenjunlia tyrosinilytica TaxID=1544741 RepID=A0A917ZSP5_9ACTN|nr:membrane protein [Wenjunlia tyrosinilytica]
MLAGVAAAFLHDLHQAEEYRDALSTVWGLAALLALALAAFGYGFTSWWFTSYRIDETELRVATGVLFRRTKHFRIDRLQAVDINRPLVGRLLGVAKLQLDLAGGKDELAYLTERDARELRSELLARAAGVAPDSGEAPERELVKVPPKELMVSIGLKLTTWWAVIGSLALALIPALLSGNWLLVLFAVPALATAARVTFLKYMREFGWTVAESPDGLRIDYGLLDRSHETVPPGRVQSLCFQQPLLWRGRDWMRVHMAVAGSRNNVLLPVAPREVALGTAARILPGVDIAAVLTRPVPRRARWRAPLWWRGLACGADGDVFVVRHGVLGRTVSVMPHAKVQSVRRTQGPWQRGLGLASVHLDAAAGSTLTASHRDAEEADRIVSAQSERSRIGRRNALPERWMSTPVPAPAPDDSREGRPDPGTDGRPPDRPSEKDGLVPPN